MEGRPYIRGQELAVSVDLLIQLVPFSLLEVLLDDPAGVDELGPELVGGGRSSRKNEQRANKNFVDFIGRRTYLASIDIAMAVYGLVYIPPLRPCLRLPRLARQAV